MFSALLARAPFAPLFTALGPPLSRLLSSDARLTHLGLALARILHGLFELIRAILVVLLLINLLY